MMQRAGLVVPLPATAEMQSAQTAVPSGQAAEAAQALPFAAAEQARPANEETT
jgi:hypothetical protein